MLSTGLHRGRLELGLLGHSGCHCAPQGCQGWGFLHQVPWSLRATSGAGTPKPLATWHQNGVDGVDHGDVGMQVLSSSDTPSACFGVSSPWGIKKNFI